jgi:hypothetical protein
METERQIVAVYGNCQAFFLAHMCNQLPSLARTTQFVGISNNTAPGQSIEPTPPEVGRAALVWEQFDEREDLPIRASVREGKPADSPTIEFPPLGVMGLWPFALPDPRNLPEPPKYPWGRYPWGDRLGREISKRGLPRADVFDAYMELSMQKMPDVKEAIHRDKFLLERRDSFCGVKMADYVYGRFTTDHMFWTWGHISSTLLAELLRRLIAATPDAFGPVTDELEAEIAKFVLDTPGIGEEQLPIHPEVARVLELEFCPPDRRYRWFTQDWTFREYMTHYIMLDKNW